MVKQSLDLSSTDVCSLQTEDPNLQCIHELLSKENSRRRSQFFMKNGLLCHQGRQRPDGGHDPVHLLVFTAE